MHDTLYCCPGVCTLEDKKLLQNWNTHFERIYKNKNIYWKDIRGRGMRVRSENKTKEKISKSSEGSCTDDKIMPGPMAFK